MITALLVTVGTIVGVVVGGILMFYFGIISVLTKVRR